MCESSMHVCPPHNSHALLRNKLKFGSSKFTRDLISIMFLEYRLCGVKTHLAQFSRLGHPKNWCSEQHVQQEGGGFK